MDELKVSIVIPVYNGATYIKDAIDSAINQTYQNIEVIVVNDGSTDETERIVKEYGDKVRYFRKENGGVSTALNLGIKEMKGDYFSWLSHDDVYYPNKIEEQIKVIKEGRGNIKFVYSNFNILDVEKDKIWAGLSTYKVYGERSNKSIFPVLFNLVNGCTVLIHKSLFDEVGLFDEELLTSQDYDMWFRMLRNIDPYYIDKRLVCNREHRKQGSKTIKAFCDNCQSLQLKMIEALTDKEINTLFGGKYKFYSDMIIFSVLCEWYDCVKKLLGLFEKIEQPKLEQCKKRVYLYGAGSNGKKVLSICSWQDIEINAVIDRNKELWGKRIEGKECISIEEVPRNSEVWVTIEEDEGIKEWLTEMGFVAKSFSETMDIVVNAIPQKEQVYRKACDCIKVIEE